MKIVYLTVILLFGLLAGCNEDAADNQAAAPAVTETFCYRNRSRTTGIFSGGGCRAFNRTGYQFRAVSGPPGTGGCAVGPGGC